MKQFSSQVFIGFLLIATSVILYLVHYAIFRDTHQIFLYLVQDIAFLPIQVLLVTLIIEQLLNAREKSRMLEKLNMVIGTFFSEVGTELLKSLNSFDTKSEETKKNIIVTNDWTDADFSSKLKTVRQYEYSLNSRKGDLPALKKFLTGKREFLLRLLENPNLLEHDTFTDLLWAVFHLTEELENRNDFIQSPNTDLDHLSGDIKRAYSLLIYEWFAYMQHLKNSYPYLFSLAIRTNPLDPNASPIVK